MNDSRIKDVNVILETADSNNGLKGRVPINRFHSSESIRRYSYHLQGENFCERAFQFPEIIAINKAGNGNEFFTFLDSPWVTGVPAVVQIDCGDVATVTGIIDTDEGGICAIVHFPSLISVPDGQPSFSDTEYDTISFESKCRHALKNFVPIGLKGMDFDFEEATCMHNLLWGGRMGFLTAEIKS
jgi:hypothetical protein